MVASFVLPPKDIMDWAESVWIMAPTASTPSTVMQRRATSSV